MWLGALEPGVLRPCQHVLQHGGFRAPTPLAHHAVNPGPHSITRGHLHPSYKHTNTNTFGPGAFGLCAFGPRAFRPWCLQTRTSRLALWDSHSETRTPRLALWGLHSEARNLRLCAFAGLHPQMHLQPHWTPCAFTGMHPHTNPQSRCPPIMSHSHVTQVTQSLSVLVISASHAQSLSPCHATPFKGRYCHPLVWSTTPKHPGFPVPVLVVSEKCALAAQLHVPLSLMLDYTS